MEYHKSPSLTSSSDLKTCFTETISRIDTDILSKADLNHSCSCSPQDEYIVWRSFTIGDGFQSLLPVAIWGNDTGLLPMRPILLTNPTLRVPLIKPSPFANGNAIRGNRFLEEIMEAFKQKLHFSYRFLIPPKTSKDRKPGYNWTEAIELLMRGEADMIPFMPMNLQHDAIEFTRPIAYTSQGMLVSSPKEPSRAFMYFRFYQKEVWISLLMTTFTVTFIMKKMIRCPASIEKPMSYFRCFWLIFGSLLQQGSPQLPRTSSCRIILATWWLSVIVITTTYSGNLVAFLISNQKEYIVNSLEELPNHKTVKLAINEESAIWENIKVPQNELFKRIHKIYWKNSNRFLSYTSETWNKNILIGVAEGNTVLIDDINTLNEERTKHNKNDTLCDFAFVPEQFASMPLAFGLRKGSSLLQSINNEFQKMMENGLLDHWKHRHDFKFDCSNEIDRINSDKRPLTTDDLQGPFYLLLLGAVSGIILLGTETIYSKLTQKAGYKIKNLVTKSHEWSIYS
ncbi:ionotropic receptor 93a-like [Argiope bruennichi]|uniref:ionotropic receptor 93a-like n=1 Tax=Argiope bruennichi TaxID=94029 RepID=UPI002494334B|nr:ionotropic receptor 93a-like [Argiope bruennichi]